MTIDGSTGYDKLRWTAVGNYGEMYFRNVEDVNIHPRLGSRNMLNSMPFGPQHYPLYEPKIASLFNNGDEQ